MDINKWIEFKPLVDKLCTYPKDMIEDALEILLQKDKLDFINVSNAYVNYLKDKEDDTKNKLIEAETCVMEGFIDKITKEKKDTSIGKRNYNHTQRCLYLINESNRFQTSELNEKYHYDKEYAKTMSWYEREKEYKENH